eukprot:1958117-Rhodomonas_salina.2
MQSAWRSSLRRYTRLSTSAHPLRCPMLTASTILPEDGQDAAAHAVRARRISRGLQGRHGRTRIRCHLVSLEGRGLLGSRTEEERRVKKEELGGGGVNEEKRRKGVNEEGRRGRRESTRGRGGGVNKEDVQQSWAQSAEDHVARCARHGMYTGNVRLDVRWALSGARRGDLSSRSTISGREIE